MRYLMLLAVWLCGTMTCAAQTLSFKTYSVKDGLPSNNIESIAQDSYGYMWFGTTDGLSRYDGQQFHNYSIRDGLPRLFVREILPDRVVPGKLWFLAGGHVCSFASNRILTYVLPVGLVRSIYQDRGGIVWCATDKGVFQIAGDSVKAFPVPECSSGVIAIAEVRDTLLWFATHTALVSYSRTSGNRSVIDITGYGEGTVWSMIADRYGNVWIGMSGGTILRIRGLTLAGVRSFPMSTTWLSVDNRANLWFGGYEGIAKIPIDYFPNATPVIYDERNGLPENTIRTISFDRENTLWIGGRDRGVTKLPSQHTLRFPIGNPSGYGLAHGLQYAASDSNGHIWVVTDRGLQEFWSDRFGGWSSNVHEMREDLRLGPIASLSFDPEGQLWIQHGFIEHIGFPFDCYRIVAGRDRYPSRLVHTRRIVSHVPLKSPLDFIVDRNHAIWHSMDRGIIRIDVSHTNPTTKLFGKEMGIPTNYVRRLFADRSGNIWGGGYATGVHKISLRGSSGSDIRQYVPVSGFPAWGIWSIFESSAGEIFAGTSGAGLSVLSGDSIRPLPEENRVPVGTVYSIAEDQHGAMWLGTSTGLFREDKPGSRQFIGDMLFAGPAAYVCGSTRNELVWYVTTNDLVIFNHFVGRRDTSRPMVYISSFEVNGLRFPLSDEVRIQHDENNCEVHFVGLSFKDEKETRYWYRLVGLEEAWRGPTRSSSVSYGHLDPGSYRLEVQAVDAGGITSSRPATLAITVLTPYWRTWWFLSTCGMLLCGSVASVYRWRARTFMREQELSRSFSLQLMESQENERKRIAGDLHDGLGQELMVIVNRAHLGLRKADPETSKLQLQEIADTASHAIQSVREIAYNLIPYHLEQIGLTNSLTGMAEQMCSLSGIECQIEIDQIDGLFGKSVELTIYRIVQECINNIVKHSGASSAKLCVRKQQGALTITGQDNGRGYDASATAAARTKPNGFGLFELSERVKLLGGVTQIESHVGRGTTVTVTIPFASQDAGVPILGRQQHFRSNEDGK